MKSVLCKNSRRLYLGYCFTSRRQTADVHAAAYNRSVATAPTDHFTTHP